MNDGLELVNVGSRVHQCGNLLDNVGGMRTEHMTAEYSARILRTFGGNHNLAEALRYALPDRRAECIPGAFLPEPHDL